jgi:hypothetical protein
LVDDADGDAAADDDDDEDDDEAFDPRAGVAA